VPTDAGPVFTHPQRASISPQNYLRALGAIWSIPTTALSRKKHRGQFEDIPEGRCNNPRYLDTQPRYLDSCQSPSALSKKQVRQWICLKPARGRPGGRTTLTAHNCIARPYRKPDRYGRNPQARRLTLSSGDRTAARERNRAERFFGGQRSRSATMSHAHQASKTAGVSMKHDTPCTCNRCLACYMYRSRCPSNIRKATHFPEKPIFRPDSLQ
jgi:hypothetical protein